MKTYRQILEQLEKQVGKKFEQLSLDSLRSLNYIKENTNRYSIDENENIIYLNLSLLKISDFSFLKELKNLTMLNLWDNEISDISALKDSRKPLSGQFRA